MPCLASPSGENVRCISLSIILMSCLSLVVKKGWMKKFQASVSQRSVNKISPLQKCWITEAFNLLLLWTSYCCRLTWVSVTEHQEDSVRQENLWVQREWHLPTLGVFACFSYLSCGWVYSPFLQQYEKGCGEVHRKNYCSSLECVQEAHKQPDSLHWKAGGQGLRPLEQPVPVPLQLCAVPLWVQDVSLPERKLGGKGVVTTETWSRDCLYWESGQSHHSKDIFDSKIWKSPSHIYFACCRITL